jgi:hypothetical protein
MVLSPGREEMPAAEGSQLMPAFLIFEGDYCFSLPATISTQAHPDQEKKMKTRSESKTKGNGSGRPARGSGEPAPSSANDECPREQMIAEAAYFRAEQRGFVPGNEMSDWLQAEVDVEALVGTRD